MRFIDFFAGIGGFRRGMELAGHECVGHCEIDKYAEASYRSMHTITEAQRSVLATMPTQQRRSEILKGEYLNENGTQMTLEALGIAIPQKPNVTVSDFLAKVSALQDTEEVLKIQEELYSLKSCGLLKKDSLKYYSQKMLQDCLTMMGGYIRYNHQCNGRLGVLCGMASA